MLGTYARKVSRDLYNRLFKLIADNHFTKKRLKKVPDEKFSSEPVSGKMLTIWKVWAENRQYPKIENFLQTPWRLISLVAFYGNIDTEKWKRILWVWIDLGINYQHINQITTTILKNVFSQFLGIFSLPNLSDLAKSVLGSLGKIQSKLSWESPVKIILEKIKSKLSWGKCE